jgi:RNA polymerase sigma-70 factor (ECF subfamily)
MLEDKVLIIRLNRGSYEALRRIYDKYRRYLLKIASALLHDTTIAEDIVHDVFMQLAQSAGHIGINGSLKAYLRTCVINRVRSRFRSDKVRYTVKLSEAESVAAEQYDCEQWIILTEESQRISKALAQVPFEQREVIILHLHGDMKFREIAELQNVSLKTVQSRYRYGLDKLRSLLDSEVEQ